MSRTTLKLRAAAAALSVGFGLTASAALAQLTPSVSQVQKVSESVTVQSVDLATRHLVVRRASGEFASLKVPPEVRNLANLKAGDTITASYYRETEIALAPADQPLPKDAAAIVSAHAPVGEMPAGFAASRIVVTGAILGIDQANHVLKVVNPKGGEVHEFTVDDPQGRRLMSQLKVGDKVTATIDESLLISAARS